MYNLNKSLHMKVLFYLGSYYIDSPQSMAIIKVTPVQGLVNTSIEFVQAMPVYGEYVDPQDITMQVLWDNLKTFINNLSTES